MFSKTLFVRLKQASNVTILIGNEFSTCSKIPLFKSKDIVLRNYKPESCHSFEEFVSNTSLCNDWYAWRKEMMNVSRPSLAHYSLIDLENKLTELTVLNASSDGLQKKAGTQSLVQLYGHLFEDKCFDCGSVSIENESPICASCGTGRLHPNVCWFNDEISAEVKAKASSVSAICEVFIALGVNELNEDISVFPFMAKGNGSYVVEISKNESALSSHCNESVRGDVNEILPKLTLLINQIM